MATWLPGFANSNVHHIYIYIVPVACNIYLYIYTVVLLLQILTVMDSNLVPVTR
jgi:hypothetical protein